LIVVALAVAAGGLTACASAQDKQACFVVSTWSAPAIRCGAAAAPMVAAVKPPPPPPEPEPAKPPEPEIEPPPPPPKATLAGEKIDLSETVQFETDSAVLVDRSKQLLDDVVRELNEHPEVKKVLIEGHTDAVASKKHNMKLSQDRVASVKAYLLSKGIEGKRLQTKAYGETRPIASNKTEEGRAKNRRVDFKILKK
jgi:OOP family OmpA-OmpF porin